MTTAIVLIGLLIPAFLWLYWHGNTRIIYDGPAQIEAQRVFLTSGREEMFVTIDMGNHGTRTAYIAHHGSYSEPVRVVLKTRPFSASWVDSITFGNGVTEKVRGGNGGDGLFISLIYAALAFFLATSGKSLGLDGSYSLLSALSLSLSGMCLTLFRFPVGETRRASGRTSLLEFGTGPGMWIVLFTILTVVTVLLFSAPGPLAIFPGITIAYATGNLAGFLLGWAWRD